MTDELRHWPRRLEAAIAGCAVLDEVMVVAETGSTQDLARERAERIGLAVVAWRQTRGRGRLGREWADTAAEGIAVTFVLPDGPDLERAIGAALAAAAAIDEVTGGSPRIGIKWPNDLVIGSRKLGGILVERCAGAALVGIGINVLQRSFPEPLAERATSLAIEAERRGARPPERIELLERLLPAVDRSVGIAPDLLVRRFAERDALCGATVRLATPQGEVAGTVVEVDLVRGIRVRPDRAVGGSERLLPVATTSVLAWTPPESR
jgi:BirA family biotin operon repressor/biotin-[acetyl-CoA-carboxylase] ligase